ncbi:hypothetical protein IHN63_06545 [Deinococcus sp. 6YEL10]|uniref:hypothetical protein n=1 Tax=Deinococcus sp. 6YEL10 TaxID=2745870 RepID=UPI001E38C860|nr:hypothetical protein [Deinococcus sp. 6YEL10]MCD0160968.1 hypothetical protein [Deinococcus sp. 6YEL10]
MKLHLQGGRLITSMQADTELMNSCQQASLPLSAGVHKDPALEPFYWPCGQLPD